MAFALLGATQLLVASRFRALILLASPLIYLAVMLRSELFAARFALPLLPFAAILAADGVLWVSNLWRSAPARRSSIALSLLAIALPASAAVIQHNTLATTRDTRLVARDWLRDHAGRFNVAVQTYGLPFGYAGQDSAGDYRLRNFYSLKSTADADRLACAGTRFVVLSNFWFERELKGAAVRRGATGYDWLFQHGTLVDTISPFREVRLYRLTPMIRPSRSGTWMPTSARARASKSGSSRMTFARSA